MPKPFNDSELHNIKNILLVTGKEMFQERGFNKFGIRELVKKANISIGMFYKFFSSKEELFLEIVSIEQKLIRAKIVNEVMKYKNNPKNALKSFYYIVVKELYDNPLMNTILLKQEYNAVTSQYNEQDMIEEREKSLGPFVELIEYWKSQNLIRDINIELVINSLRSLVYLNFHKTEIGKDKFNDVIEFLVDQICSYVDIGE